MGDAGSGFSTEHERMLEALLDVVIPPSSDGQLPGAGALGLTEHVARTVRQTPMLGPVVEYGLSALADLAAARRAGGWPVLSMEERADVLREFTATDQFFLPAFMFLVYSGYYQHPRVVEVLGLEARAPHPEGYAMDAGDFTLLDAVRRRGPIHRTD
jgi:gluconate 2-dehydrogenase subunit 3-like protein